MEPKSAILLFILRLMGFQAEDSGDLARLNGSREYVRAKVTTAHRMAILVTDATKTEHQERLSSWRRGEPKPKAMDAEILAAVIFKESSFREDVTGKHGEVGLGQIKPGGSAWNLLERELGREVAEEEMRKPEVNVKAALLLLKSAQRKCGAEPLKYLPRYNGSQTCEPTDYSRKVVGMVEGAKRPKLVALKDLPTVPID